ncbi:MAG: LacI family DNA-binding transcriptional regulator [Anaerolineae bacterium]|nr:LacI family DNA-binding transcriptional regulator [Anaerolineae bacterium]
MPTIKEVAEAAGVSFKTVSRVINGDANVRPETRAKVMDAVARLGYRPNQIARQMRTQRSHLIGFISDEIVTTPFAFNIIKGAQQEAWRHGLMLLVVNTASDREHEDEAVEMLLMRQVEGVIYATMRHMIIELPPMLREVPVMLLNCRSADGSLASVVPDEVDAGFKATEILLKKGHRRIPFINLEPTAVAAVGRLQGYRQALEAAGIEFDPALIRNTYGNSADGYAQARALLAEGPPPTAIVCGNDAVAAGVYEGIKERGLRIPQDIAVISFDNLELIATMLKPALSTMALPHLEMGEWAVRHLMQSGLRSSTKPDQVEHAMLPCPYIERESV